MRIRWERARHLRSWEPFILLSCQESQCTVALGPMPALSSRSQQATGPHGRVLTKDGHEQTVQVNYLAPYLLTRLLEDTLDRSEVSRVVNVSSSLHRGGRINWNDLNWKRPYNRGTAYAQSKLAVTTAVAGQKIVDAGTANACGVVYTAVVSADHPAIAPVTMLSNSARVAPSRAWIERPCTMVA